MVDEGCESSEVRTVPLRRPPCIPNRDDTADSQIISAALSLSPVPFISGPHQSRSVRTRDAPITYPPTVVSRETFFYSFLLITWRTNGSHHSQFAHNILTWKSLKGHTTDALNSYSFFCCCCGWGCALLVACGVTTAPIPLSLKEMKKTKCDRELPNRYHGDNLELGCFDSISWDPVKSGGVIILSRGRDP